MLAWCLSNPAQALGLDELRVQSGLGQNLRASLNLVGANDLPASCIKARVESAEGQLLANANIALTPKPSSTAILLTTRQGVNEPIAKIVVDISCDTQLHREYQVLLDPPQLMSAKSELPTVQPAAAANAELAAREDQAGVPARKPVQAMRRERRLRAGAGTATELPSIAAFIPAKPAAVSAAKPKDVLKLSDDSAPVSTDLRLSDTLSEALGVSAQTMDELRAAQARMAAELRGEDPRQTAATQLKVEGQRMQLLQTEAQQLKLQQQRDKTAIDELRQNSYSRNWVLALLGLVLIGLVTIAGLLVHIARLNKRSAFTWAPAPEAAHPEEQGKDIEELIDRVKATYASVGLSTQYAAPTPANDAQQDAVGVTDALAMEVPSVMPQSRSVASAQPAAAHKLPSLEESNSSTFNFFASRNNSVKVEEISDVTQEAEFWMSVNDPQRAIEILEPQTAIESPDSPVPWLYLLDLYRVTKNQEKYDGLRDRFILIFNANIPDFDTPPDESGERQLEDFEHLTQRICSMWSSKDILPFLESLLIDDRDGKRMGFELPVYRDILLLIAVANELERMRAAEQTAAPRGAPPAEPLSFETMDFGKPASR